MYINGRVRPTIRILCKNRNFESLPNTSLIDGIEVATSLTENFQVFILLVFWNSLLKMRSNNRKLCEAVEFVNFCIDERCRLTPKAGFWWGWSGFFEAKFYRRNRTGYRFQWSCILGEAYEFWYGLLIYEFRKFSVGCRTNLFFKILPIKNQILEHWKKFAC